MESDNWYCQQLEVKWIPINARDTFYTWQIRNAIINLTNHRIYGKLCNWSDIEFIYNFKLQNQSENYIFLLYSVYHAFNIALNINPKSCYNSVNLHYNSLIKLKTKKINVNLLLNSITALNCDVISVIEHYYTLLFLWG